MAAFAVGQFHREAVPPVPSGFALLEGMESLGSGTTLAGSVQVRVLRVSDAERLAADYWVDKEYNGRGVGSAAVAYAVGAAQAELGLHRLQAATLQHNAASQKILRRSGFEKIGLAPAYLKIAGAWQDHCLYQRILY